MSAPTTVEAGTPATPPRGLTRAVLEAVVLLAAAALGGLAIVATTAWAQGALGAGPDPVVLYFVGGGLATLWLAVMGYGYLRVRPVAIPWAWPTRRGLAWIAGGTVLILALTVAVSAIGAMVGATGQTNFLTGAAADNPLLVYGVAFVAVLVFIGPVEEYLYRGVIQGRLRQHVGAVAAIGLTSVGFGLGHLFSYWYGGSDLLSAGVWLAIVSIAVVSAVLGAIYERTGNLVVVAVIHGVVNATLIGLALAVALG